MIDPLDLVTLELALPTPPMDAAARQRKLRAERKKAGVKPMHVNPAERAVLAQALQLWHGMAPTDTAAALLKKVAPAGTAVPSERTAGEDLRPVLLSKRDRVYLGNALDMYEFNHPGSGYTAQYVAKNLLDLYQRIDPPYRNTATWPRDEDRDAWYSKQVWHNICDSYKSKQTKAEAESQAARSELEQARAEVAHLRAELLQLATELGVPVPAPVPSPAAAEEPVDVAAPEPFSLQLMRRHKWRAGREEDAALVSIQVVPHEGQWMWAANLCSSNGSGYNYLPLPKWGRFAATAETALAQAAAEVQDFAGRATAAEQKRIAAWLRCEVGSYSDASSSVTVTTGPKE